MKTLPYTTISLLATLVTGLLLGGRAWLEKTPDGWLVLDLIRLAVPALIALISALLLLLFSFKKATFVNKLKAISKQLLIGCILISAVSLGLLDIAKGVSPYIVLPGLAVFGSLVWNKPRTMLAGLVCALASLGLGFQIWNPPVGLQAISFMVTAVILVLFSADTVRRNLAPTEAKLKDLEAENRTLWDLSYRDSLTGLYNRRYIQQSAQHMFARAVRYREQLHVLMLDIDHFKKVNDKLGHAVGDEVLKAVATTIQAYVRSSDAVARYGGEEFIVYIVQANPELAQFIANRIRDGVAALKLETVPWQVTISIGVTGLQENDTLDGLVERADKFLYASKHQGRNRVSGY